MDKHDENMNANPQAEKLANETGALAEMTALYYTTLLKNGIDCGMASVLTEIYLKIMLRRD